MTLFENFLAPETDRALDDTDDDEYGFAEIAKKLAPSLADAAKSDGMVIGIEGPWGSGKTSLLNFVRRELDTQDAGKLHVITLAPWLTGDAVSLIGSLTDAMADILDSQEEETQTSSFLGLNKKKVAKYGDLFRRYGARTGRTLAPLANVAAMIYPPAAIVGAGLGVGADYLDKLGRLPTDAEVKKLISGKLASLDVRFLVLVDDLDRLEPAQAAEVVRMVRSVADFPKVAYVMCYDRSVLAHALEEGLKVKDGDAFLQKVVQLTFSIPLPEPFDLRLSLREKVIAIYTEVNGHLPGTDELEDIKLAVDREGSALKTPREVKLALNAIKFAYRNMAEYLYFPDLCRISLIKILNPALHGWLESYLSIRSVIFTGDTQIEKDDLIEMSNELAEILPSETIGSTRSVWNLSLFIPSIQQDKNPEKRIFQKEYNDKLSPFLKLKRLGSPIHYRYYFALNGPRSALSDAAFTELNELAKSGKTALIAKLNEYIKAPRPLGQSWLEQILDRFPSEHLQALTIPQIICFGVAIADVMDNAMLERNEIRFMARSLSDKAGRLVGDVITIVRQSSPDLLLPMLDELIKDSPSLSWLVGDFIRSELFRHGIAGEKPRPPEEWHLTAEELEKASAILSERVAKAAADGSLARYPELASMLYGWRNLVGEEVPKAWAAAYTKDDDNLLFLLLELRGLSISDRVYRPLETSTIDRFLDTVEVESRLQKIEEKDLPSKQKEQLARVQEAIRIGKSRH